MNYRQDSCIGTYNLREENIKLIIIAKEKPSTPISTVQGDLIVTSDGELGRLLCGLVWKLRWERRRGVSYAAVKEKRVPGRSQS